MQVQSIERISKFPTDMIRLNSPKGMAPPSQGGAIHGRTDRRPVGAYPTSIAQTQETWTAQGSRPQDHQRDPLGSSLGSPLEGYAPQVRLSRDLLARLIHWQREGVWDQVWRGMLRNLDDQKRLDWAKAYLDASFAAAKKGALESV